MGYTLGWFENDVTVGGVTIALIILGRTLWMWWPGVGALRKSWQQHLLLLGPFLGAFCYGVLIPMTAGGILLNVGNAGVSLMNWLGDAALWLGVGSEWAQPAARAESITLGWQGNALMLVFAFLIPVWAKREGDVWPGVVCGLGLGTSAGVTGLVAVPLSQAWNVAGQTVYGVFV